MGRPKREPLPAGVEETLARMETWRRTRKSGEGMSEDLWSEAVSWAKHFGVNPVCRTLGLSYTDLKRRLGTGHKVLRYCPDPVQPTFVELNGSNFLGDLQVGPVLEVTNPDGGRMLLRLPAGSLVDPCGLAGVSWLTELIAPRSPWLLGFRLCKCRT